MEKYIGIDESSLSMEVSFDEMSFIDDSIVHFEFAETVIPSLFVLALVVVIEPGCHYYSISYIYLYRQKEVSKCDLEWTFFYELRKMADFLTWKFLFVLLWKNRNNNSSVKWSKKY